MQEESELILVIGRFVDYLALVTSKLCLQMGLVAEDVGLQREVKELEGILEKLQARVRLQATQEIKELEAELRRLQDRDGK